MIKHIRICTEPYMINKLDLGLALSFPVAKGKKKVSSVKKIHITPEVKNTSLYKSHIAKAYTIIHLHCLISSFTSVYILIFNHINLHFQENLSEYWLLKIKPDSILFLHISLLGRKIKFKI